MEALLPSEISRLVLGFIEEQNCTEAAKLFLETCPHLKECAAAAQCGRKFGTQVYGKNLVNILDEYSLIQSIVQERIQELPENASLQLKSSCGNFLPDQVKHLLNGKSAAQRFHVNITVPTQVAVPQSNITSLGGLISNSSQCGQRSKSRIVGSSPASSRPRQRSTHLLQEKRLTLRSQDSLEDVTASVTVQRVEATQLQSLAGEREEENGSLLDPKTGEFISPCDKSRIEKCEGPKSGPVESTNNQNKEVVCSEEVVKFGSEVFGRTSGGRTSLDKFVSDILACHETEESRQKEGNDPSQLVGSSVIASESCAVEQSTKPALTPSFKSHASIQSPTEAHKTPHESYLFTPKRSGAKRKAKPTPLKMITPLKSKAAPEALDSSEVVVDPKFFIGPLLDNRQLHEKIAENINQLIWSCGGEGTSEVAVEGVPESIPVSTSGDHELEKAIKTVVDKTEADPLFERLLNEILGPEYEDENSMLGDKSESEMVLNTKTPEGRKGMSLEDQNEEAINSILKAQPMEEEPKSSRGLCKDKVHSVKIVRGRPSGACKSIFSEVAGQGKNTSGTNLPTVDNEKNGSQVNKLVLVPIDNNVGPPLNFPRVNINGVDQYIVPVESAQPIPVNPSPDTPAPVNQFILRKATSEDLKNINSKPIVLPINSTELTPIVPTSTKPSYFHLQLQNPLTFATSTPSTSGAFIPITNSVIEGCQNNAMISKAAEGQSVAKESESKVNKPIKGAEKESTPRVLNPRTERAVTESRLEPPKATPLMSIGTRRASLSTPRRSRSSGHVRALDFGSTPPSKEDSQLVNLSPEDSKLMRHSAASKTMRKDLQKALDSSDKLPDPLTCIATRSPPPRLSKAWNKVGVDLIFGGSPNETAGQESEANDTEVKINKKNVEEASQWESPKLRLKGTWDADLRAIVSSAELKPKLTKKQQRAKERKERAQKRAEEAVKKKNVREEVSKKEMEGQKGKSGAENHTLKDKSSIEEKSTEEITSEDAKEEENSCSKGKQRRRNKGEQMQKKKAVPKKSLEKSVPMVDANNSHLSPEKTWVVQQSPGSYATKRSIHEVAQSDMESEKRPGSARKHLDLQETPRKSDLSIASLRRFCIADDIHSISACDRTTLTVVETPLFPMTPNINLLNTPNGQDSTEFAETFPSYYKPSALQIVEKESEETVVSKCQVQEGEMREDISQSVDASADISKVNGSNMEEEMEVNESSSKRKNVKGKVSAKKRSCKARKPVVRKSGKQMQSKSVKKEQELVTDEEQPQRRVLRPRKSKTSYVEEPLEDEGKRNNRSKKVESDEDYPLSNLQRKSGKGGDDSIEVGSTPEPLSKESNQKLFDSVASEEEEAQTQEAEILARSISLKLSPLCPKMTPLEEEDDDSVASDGPLVRRTPNKPVAKPLVLSSSSSSGSDSSTSTSFSSDMSSDEDSRPPKTNSNEKCLDSNENYHTLEVNVNNSNVTKMPLSEPLKSSDTPKSPASDNQSAHKSLDKAQNLIGELDAGKMVADEMVQNSNLVKHQSDKDVENEAVVEKVSCHSNAVGTNENEKDKDIEEELKSKKERADEKEKNLSKTNSSAEQRRSDDVKMRKDNLDKLLCLNKTQQESPEKQEEVALGIGGDSTSIMNPSFADLSLTNELERKRQRMIQVLKGPANLRGKGNTERKTTLAKSQNLISPSKAENGNSKENKNTLQKMSVLADKVNHENNCEQKKVEEEDEEDCPTLRLSEGEDCSSPSKRILPSPRAFELLDSVEEKMAFMHADARSPTMKKTARMSCSPHSSKESPQSSVKVDQEKGISNETICSSKEMKKTVVMEIEPIPSTSKASEKMHRAAERMHKAAERKKDAMSEGRTCNITFRKRNETEKSKAASRGHQPCSSNQVSSNFTGNKEMKKKPSDSSLEKNRSSGGIDAESANHGEKEADEWKESKRKKRSNLCAEDNQEKEASMASNIDGSVSFELSKVSAEEKDLKARASCSDKSSRNVPKETKSADKEMKSSNAKEGKSKDKKYNNKVMKSVKCIAKDSLFEERSVKKSDMTTPSHYQSDSAASKCDENGAIGEKICENDVDHFNIKGKQHLIPLELMGMNKEAVKLALESNAGKQRGNPEEEMAKADSEHGKVEEEKNSRSHKTPSRDCLGKDTDICNAKEKTKLYNQKKESDCSLAENSIHRPENKKSEIGGRSHKSNISPGAGKEKKSELRKDRFSSKLQNNIDAISKDSALVNSDKSLERRKELDNDSDACLNDDCVVSPSVTEISFELDEGVVRLTMSPYIELLSYHERGLRKEASPQLAFLDQGGGKCLSRRKRKFSNLFDDEAVKERTKKESNIMRNNVDDLKIKKVLETLNNPSSGSVDDDSLFTYTVLGCVDSEEMHTKEDEERILPLKKRRTTTEETPVKFHPESVDGPHGNTGIISQLKNMEIEDFLSKVHGDGS